MNGSQESGSVWPATVDQSGRVLLPAELRNAMPAKPGASLLWIKDEHGVHLRSFEESLAEIQDYYRNLAPADDIWSNAIVDQRRQDAAHE